MLTRLAAAVDTNVMLDVLSSHDLINFGEKRAVDGRFSDYKDPEFRFRCRRARAGLLLGCHLHNLKATTFSLFEPTRVMGELVPPDTPPGTSFPRDFATVSIHMVHDVVFSQWRHIEPRIPERERSTRADKKLLAVARWADVPLITNEGWNRDGVRDVGLRARCKRRGVEVGTAEESWAEQIDPNLEISRFFDRLESASRVYLEEHRAVHGDDQMPKVLQYVSDFYAMVFEHGDPAKSP